MVPKQSTRRPLHGARTIESRLWLRKVQTRGKWTWETGCEPPTGSAANFANAWSEHNRLIRPLSRQKLSLDSREDSKKHLFSICRDAGYTFRLGAKERGVCVFWHRPLDFFGCRYFLSSAESYRAKASMDFGFLISGKRRSFDFWTKIFAC
jgi:hypothetical protein